MDKVETPERPGRVKPWPKTALGWLGFCLLAVLIALFLFIAVIDLIASDYLWYLASRGTTFGVWGVLSVVSALMSLVAIVGAGFALRRRRMVMALAFAALTLPVHFVIEGSRCDTTALCRTYGWAALPADAFASTVRIRSVTDPNEAREIAFGALSKAGSDDSPFREKRFGDHWIVSAIDEDGRPGAQAVRIDTRTAKTRFVPCPEDKIQCGMDMPTASDGRSPYRNDSAGIAAAFPASLSVCTSRGDDGEPRGFNGAVRSPDVTCEDFEAPPEMQIGVEVARWRLDGCKVTEAPSLPWRPMSPETLKLFSRTPALAGRPSLACELRDGDDIQLSVYATARSGSRDTLYEAYIVTSPARLAEDVRQFERFLADVSIGT